ncbi:GT-D fold domain-containing glycosyltransferase [Arthrobacter sp. NPDC055138]
MSSRARLRRLVTGDSAAKLAVMREQTKLIRQQNALLASQNKQLSESLAFIAAESKRTRAAAENIRGVVMAPIRQEISELIQARQLTFMESVAALRDGRKSLARFGDGEFRLMYRLEHKLKFQRNTPELMAALRGVLTDPSPNTLIGMPQVFLGIHWSIVFAETWHFVRPLVEGHDRFLNSHITRPMFFQHHGQDAVDAWRSVWEGRRATVVTGKGSRFDLVPALFDNLEQVKFIDSTPTDAFFDLDRLIGDITDSGMDLVLLSLGPAATVAADMLAARGIQALDIGHLSSSYENVLMGAELPEHVPAIRR